MGLDSYFQRTDASPQEITYPPDLKLCGGMFSGHGSDGSFRGKVYVSFFDTVLNTSLYQEIEPPVVRELADKLAGLASEYHGQGWHQTTGWVQESNPEGYSSVSWQELSGLQCLFEAAAQQHLKLVASQ